jgi:predicted neutral ceramidase superfamily lipid hydrolase
VNIFHGSSSVHVHMGEKEVFQKLQKVVFSSIRRAKYLFVIDFIPSLIIAVLAFSYLHHII